MLKAHVDRESPGGAKFPEMWDLAICAFEAGLIAARMFLQVLV